MAEGKKKSSDTQDWINKERMPDFAADEGIGVITLPFSGLSNYNQQIPAMAAVTSNINTGSWQHPQTVFSQNQTSPNIGSNLHQSLLLQNQFGGHMLSSRPNIYQFSAQPSSYPSNFSLHQQMQPSTGCHSTNLMGRYHGNFNILQSFDQTVMLENSARQNGLMPERAHPESLHMSAFHQTQAPILGSSQALSEFAPRPELVNDYWMDEAYHKILQIKDLYLADVLTLHKRSQEMKNSMNNAEIVATCERIRISTEKAYNFLNMSRPDISRWKKEKLYQTMNDITNYANQARTSNSLVQNQNRQIQFNGFNPTRPSGPSVQTGLDQRAVRVVLSPTQPNNNYIFSQWNSVATVSPATENQINGQAHKRLKSMQQVGQTVKEGTSSKKILGFGQRYSRLSGGFTPLRKKDIQLSPFSSSKLSKSAGVSVSGSSSPVLLSPLTPCSKPVDFVKSPLSVDESSKFPQTSGNQQLKDPCRNVTLTDERLLMNSSMNSELAENEKKRPMDEDGNQVKRLVDADTGAVTSLTDGTIENFLHDDSTKHVSQVVADVIRNLEMKTMANDQPGPMTCHERITEMPSDVLFEEIEVINQRFMELKVDVMNKDAVSRARFDECALVRCSYIPIGPASQHMIHKLNIELIVPPKYPYLSPTVSEKMLSDCGDSDDGKSLWTKAKSNFGLRLRQIPDSLSVKQIARAWEDSAREVFLEYAVQMGGGSFSSKYGHW